MTVRKSPRLAKRTGEKFPGFVAPQLKKTNTYDYRALPGRTVRFALTDSDGVYFDVVMQPSGSVYIRFKDDVRNMLSIEPWTSNSVVLRGAE